MSHIDSEVDLYNYDYMIVNKAEKVIFARDGVIFGEMNRADIDLYIKIKKSDKGSERYCDYKLLDRHNISRTYHPGFNEFCYHKLSNPSFVYGLSLCTIKELVNELSL